MAGVTTGFPASSSAQKYEDIPIPINIETVREEPGLKVGMVEFEDKYVSVRLETDGTRDKRHREVVGYKDKIRPMNDATSASTAVIEKNEVAGLQQAVAPASAHENVIKDFTSFEDTGPECNHVNESGKHEMSGESYTLTRPADVVGKESLAAAIGYFLGPGRVPALITIAVGVAFALQGPVYYFGQRDVDGGCFRGRCGFRLTEKRSGDGGVNAPKKLDWDEFLSRTDKQGTTVGHLS